MPVNSNDTIEIRQTVDGKPVEASTGPSKSPSVTPQNRKKMAALRRPDPYLWGIYLMLLLISVIELFSASSTEVTVGNVYSPLIRHCIFLAIGLGIVLWLQNTPYVIICRFSWVFAYISLTLLILSSVAGVEINGAQRALRFAGITIQPAEMVKLAVVCLLAYILGKNQRKGGVSNRGVYTSGIVVLVFSALLFKNGMTNMLLLMGVSIAMMIIGGIPLKKVVFIVIIYVVGGIAIYSIRSIGPSAPDEFEELKNEHVLTASADPGAAVHTKSKGRNINRRVTRKNRIKSFVRGVHPDDPITDENRQVVLAKFAQANGGLIGQGPGNSRESSRLPLAFSDYIYSIIVEDTGFLGGALVMILFLLLLGRAGRVAFKLSRATPAFLIMGCAVMIVFQALVHMAIVTGVFPVSGQPLPFISKGGTSVLVMSAAVGMMLSVCRFASYSSDGRKTVKAELNALPEDMQAGNFSNTTQNSK